MERPPLTIAVWRRCCHFYIQSFALAIFIGSAKAGCAFCSVLLDEFIVADDGDELTYLAIVLRKSSG